MSDTQKAYRKAWREKNAERIRAQKKAWREKNAERIRAQKKAWREKNAERIRAQNKAWREKNADKVRASERASKARYAEKNRVRKKAYREVNADRVRATYEAYKEKNAEKIRAVNKAYKVKNAEKIRARRKAYRETNLDNIRTKKRERNAANIETLRAKQKARRDTIKPLLRAKWKEYYEKNKEKLRAVKRAHYHATKDSELRRLQRKARVEAKGPYRAPRVYPKVVANVLKTQAGIRDIAVDISDDVIVQLKWTPCFYCGTLNADGVSGIDRLDSFEGYVEGNVVPCCAACNRMKLAVDPVTFVKRCCRVSRHHGGPGQEFPEVAFPRKRKLYFYKDTALRRGIDVTMSKEEAEALAFEDCVYCGQPGGATGNGIDRIDSSLGYDPSNCVAACGPCNMSKGKQSKDDFIAKCKAVATRAPVVFDKIPAHISTNLKWWKADRKRRDTGDDTGDDDTGDGMRIEASEAGRATECVEEDDFIYYGWRPPKRRRR